MNTGKKNYAVIVLIGIVIVFMIITMLGHVRYPWRALKAVFVSNDISLSSFKEGFQSRLTDSFALKNHFINLNGWFAGFLDQTTCNEVIKLNNGMLTNDIPEIDVSPYAKNALEFKDFLAEQGIEFLYISEPYKVDLCKQLLPVGIENSGNETASALNSLLEDGGVHVLDLRPELSATPEQVERYFFKTDHHWTFEGAFIAFQRIGEELCKLFPEESIELSYANFDQWEARTLKNWSLGSHGRRVGIYYGGTDDITYYTPRFETSMSCAIPNHVQLYKGDFNTANIRKRYIEQRNYFDNNAYEMYIGGQYPLVCHRNPLAPNDLRILMVIDSFGRPVQAYLSTLFQEVDVIDPRQYDFNIAEYVQYSQPDVVIEMIYPRSIVNEANFEYGCAEAAATDFHSRQEILDAQDTVVEDGYTSLPVRLAPGRTYILQFDDVEFSVDMPDGAAIALFATETGTQISATVFDIEYCREYSNFSWFFTVPESTGTNLELRFYAGLPDNPTNGATVYRGVHLYAVGQDLLSPKT